MTITAEHSTMLYTLSERIKKQKEEYYRSRVRVASERSRLITESWKETDGEPVVLRRAKAFKKFLEEAPIVIHEGELLVGSQTKYVRGVYPCTELEETENTRQNLSSQHIQTISPSVYGIISDEDKKSLLDDLDYWTGRTPCDQIRVMYRNLWGSLCDGFSEAGIWTEPEGSIGGRTCNWSMLLNIGLDAVMAKAREQMKTLKALNEAEVRKLFFLQAVLIVCQAAEDFAHRYSQLAQRMGALERNPVRHAELSKIAEICDWVPAKPARNFYEALQSFWFGLLLLNLECVSKGETPGRLDQFLYPFYEKDIEEGRLNRDQAWELLCSLWMKFLRLDCYGSQGLRKRSQASQFNNVTIGGVTPDGRDAVNDLSFLILEVIRAFKSHQPHASVRYHDGIDHEFFLRALEVNRDHGAGVPAFFNDKVALLALAKKGIPIEEVRNWGPQGCVEMSIMNSSGIYVPGPYYNLPKMLELTIENGMDLKTRRQIGPATGDPREFKTFDDFYEAFKKQVGWFVDHMVAANNVWMVFRQDTFALPFHSALLDGCIDSGVDALAGGSRWNKKFMMSIRPFGHVNTVNSLLVIKKLIYEEKQLTWDQLVQALRANFEGKEEVRAVLLSAPKWGNDDDEVDNLMPELFRWTEQQIIGQKNPYGEPYTCSRQGLTLNWQFGKVVGALPDGRKAYEALSDGSLSPMRGTDVRGPTGVFNSAAKVDSTNSECTLLNLKFHPASLRSRDNLKKLGSLIKTYFDRYGYHCQFNIVSAETLLDAKRHPERYRDLVVRVAGFSAHFVDLEPKVQDEIIARTEHCVD